jgi:hypothetical protein
MKQNPGRRSFLAATGASATAALAGCSNQNAPSQTDGEDTEETPDAEATLTIQIQGDRDELTSFQEELQEDVENGNITSTEAQQEFQNKQDELIEEAANAFEKTTADDDAVSIEDSSPEYGMLRITAPATTFVDGLEEGELAAVLPAGYYDQYIQQQQLQERLSQQTDAQGNNTTSE